jgi:hypothetical protein
LEENKMQISELVEASLANVSRVTSRVLQDLSPQELAWCAKDDCNPIGFIYFHMARFEDNFMLSRILNKTPLWESQKWYEKMNMAASETAGGYTAEQIKAFKVPDIKVLQAYYDAVRAEVLQALKMMDSSQLDRIVKTPWSEVPAGSLLAMAITHQAGHAGEMSYIRGLQKGLNK